MARGAASPPSVGDGAGSAFNPEQEDAPPLVSKAGVAVVTPKAGGALEGPPAPTSASMDGDSSAANMATRHSLIPARLATSSWLRSISRDVDGDSFGGDDLGGDGDFLGGEEDLGGDEDLGKVEKDVPHAGAAPTAAQEPLLFLVAPSAVVEVACLSSGELNLR